MWNCGFCKIQKYLIPVPTLLQDEARTPASLDGGTLLFLLKTRDNLVWVEFSVSCDFFPFNLYFSHFVNFLFVFLLWPWVAVWARDTRHVRHVFPANKWPGSGRISRVTTILFLARHHCQAGVSLQPANPEIYRVGEQWSAGQGSRALRDISQ